MAMNDQRTERRMQRLSLAAERRRQSRLNDGDDEPYRVINFAELCRLLQCPICLGIIRKTRTVMECMHRFCKECIEKSMRLGNNECPACRTHCASRRSLRKDPNFDSLIATFFPDIDDFEKEELILPDDIIESLQRMQKAYRMTLKRQTAAKGKKRAAAAVIKRSRVKYLRSLALKRRRNARNAAEIPGASRNGGGPLSPAAEESETETEAMTETDTTEVEAQRDTNSEAETEAEAEIPQHAFSNAIVIEDGTDEEINVPEDEPIRDVSSSSDEDMNVPEADEPMRDMIRSSATLVWGEYSQWSNTHNNNANDAVARRTNRLNSLIAYLSNSQQNDDELDIFIKLVPFGERTVPILRRPYLTGRPKLTIGQLCQYVANQTSLQTEEVELYLVKASQGSIIITGDGKLYPNNVELQFLKREEETLAELKIKNLSSGYQVIAYKRKMWNLNVVPWAE